MNAVTELKQPFTPQMETMVKYAKKKKPEVLLMAMVVGDEVFCDWSKAKCEDLFALRALIDNQIDQATFRENTKYSFLPPEFYAHWPDDPDELA